MHPRWQFKSKNNTCTCVLTKISKKWVTKVEEKKVSFNDLNSSTKCSTVEPRYKEVGYNKTLCPNKVILLVPALYIS